MSSIIKFIILLIFFCGPWTGQASIDQYPRLNQVEISPLPQHEYVVYVSLSTTCPCSQSHLPHLQELAKDFPEYLIVGFHADAMTRIDEAREFFVQQKLNFPIVQDTNFTLSQKFQAVTTPQAFVVSAKDQKIVYEGAVSDSAHFSPDNDLILKQSLLHLRDGVKIKQTKTRPHGCAINYSL